MHEGEDGDGHGDGHGPSPLALLVAVVLVVAAGLFLSSRIRDMTRMQDCLLSGRTNCAPVDAPEGN